jgi:hypothetical protein
LKDNGTKRNATGFYLEVTTQKEGMFFLSDMGKKGFDGRV